MGTASHRTEWASAAASRYDMLVTHKLVMTVFVEDDEVEPVARAITRGASTGSLGDGFISVSELAAVYPIRAPQAQRHSSK